MEDHNINPNASYVDPVRQEPTIRTTSDAPKKGGKGFPKWIAAVIGVMLILAVGGFFIARSLGEVEEADPSPSGAGLSTFPTPDTVATPAPTEEAADVDKSEVKIKVLNGTGTAGEASFLKGKLEDLGYSEVEAANADSQDETETTVTFTEELPQTIVDEITTELEGIYSSVNTERGTVSGDFDIEILTGPRKGASATGTPRAAASPTATSKATSTPKPTSSN